MIKRRKVVLIIGKTGTGKTHLAKELLTKAKRSIIFDAHFEYEGFFVYSFPEFLEIMEQVQHDKTFRICCRFRSAADTEHALMLCAYHLHDYVLFIEEAEMYFDARSNNEEIKHTVNYGRHQRISLVGITTRAPQVNIQFRAQYNSIISFHQTEPNDLDGLEKYGFSRGEIESLPLHQYCFIGEDISKISFE